MENVRQVLLLSLLGGFLRNCISRMLAAASVVLLPTSAFASLDCDALKMGTAPFQITSEEVLTANGTSRMLTVIAQVYRSPNGGNVEISSLPGRKRKSKSLYGIDVDLLMERTSGRSIRIMISNVPDKDQLGQKHDFSIDTSTTTATNKTEVPISTKYTYVGEGTIELSGCNFPVLKYSEISSLMSKRTDFAYSPDLRLKLSSKEVNSFGGSLDSTEIRALTLTTSFQPLPEPKD